MIAKNEEKNIEKCIKSYKDIVHEIIVVDTGSTDKTIDLAKGLGAQVYKFHWANDFAEAKNYALSKAIGDWIIFLDADEYFDKESADKVPRLLDELKNTTYNAIGCKIINIDQDKNNMIQGSFLNIRIFKKDSGIQYIGNIHEKIQNLKGKINVAAYYNKISVYHTGYSTKINKGKAQRNLDILLENIKKNGHEEEYYHYLADCYVSLEDYDKAIEYARLQISSGKEILGNNTKHYITIIKSLINLNAPKEKVENEIKNAIYHFPDHPDFYLSYADFLMTEKRYKESLYNFLKFFHCKNEYKGIEADHTEGFMDTAYMKTGFIYQMQNSENKAVEYYYQSLKRNKYSSDSFRLLFSVINEQEDNEIIHLLNTIYDVEREKDIEFIVNKLIKTKNKYVLGYYVNVWYKKFNKQDKSFLFVLLSGGKYQTCFNIFYESYKKDFSKEVAIYAIIAAILSEKKENINLIQKWVKPSLKRIIEAWSSDKAKLLEFDIEDYLVILKELVFIDRRRSILNKYMLLRQNFSKQGKTKVLYEMAKMMQDCFIYAEAIVLYKEYLVTIEQSDDVKVMNMAIGYCYYKLREYQNASIYFGTALENGYIENDIKEFLQWIKEQTGEEVIKELTQKLINRFYQLKSE